jgi:hypothetical protein
MPAAKLHLAEDVVRQLFEVKARNETHTKTPVTFFVNHAQTI